MTVASAANVELWYVEEVAGEIPATPEWKPFRYSTHSLQKTSERLSSEEIRSGRHKTPDRRGNSSVAGDISTHLFFGAHDDFLQAGFCGTWATNTLKTAATRRSFAILERHKDIGVDYIYTGMEVNTVAFAMPLSEKIGLTFGMVGTGHEQYTLPVDSTFAAVTTTDFMTTLEGGLQVDGSPFLGATDLNFNLNNGIAAIYSLFANDPYDKTIDTITADGNLTAYLEDSTYYGKYLSETEFTILATLTDGTNTYTLQAPRANPVNGNKSRNNNEYVVNIEFSAGFDSTAGSELVLTRSA